MAVVNTEKPITSSLSVQYIEKLTGLYPVLRWENLADTENGRPIPAVAAGEGPGRVLYAGAFHGNEWITALVLLRFLEDLARAWTTGTALGRTDARFLLERTTVFCVPLVNPDGVDLVTGAATEAEQEQAKILAARYPRIPYPDGWKANLAGVDLNLQYPAGWETAREIKFLQGYTSPGPRDFVGRAPLCQPESAALAAYTERVDPRLVLAYHAQGREIYWQYGGYDIPGAEKLGRRFAALSGYTLADVPYNSGFAGYKDWFIERFRRPGYTVEVGKGQNPLPISQFEQIYRENLGILTEAALG